MIIKKTYEIDISKIQRRKPWTFSFPPNKQKDSAKIHTLTGIQNRDFHIFACEFSCVTYQSQMENIETLLIDKCEDFQDHHKCIFSTLVF